MYQLQLSRYLNKKIKINSTVDLNKQMRFKNK